ncbi:peptide deformylase [Microbacterium endophyticum]|uniref:Peptide deformylase n=1 Tax=Microbacterium endophyticum TaxID=1526412 RepID=A0A7W4V4R7_9MICO|nr:peptide deformylase [Microbacterium endophyticum]MBB2976203.1 peptide deformylase [Microbacterium endophyticum]NIK36500.1 peptide deformylase [Microbacterium endophyticum]
MAVRSIRVFGDPVLKSSCAVITTIDAGTHALVQDLLDTVELPGRAGVAAPQIGVGVRAFSYNIDGDIGYVLNPTLVEVRGEPELIGEGCLSVPGLWHDTPRYPWAKAVGIDLEGNEVVLEGEGLLAQALQHETDHLDGMLYLDRLTPLTRRAAMREVRESDWF